MSEVITLIEMFPELEEKTLSAIWESCKGDFSAALDEALTLTSLKGDQGLSHGGDAQGGGVGEAWESPRLEGNSSESSDDPELNPFLERPERNNGHTQRLPWDPKVSKAGYVMGSGELGLLNELQLPRRGSVVALAPDFLRVPRVEERGDPLTAALRDGGSHGREVAADASSATRISTPSSDGNQVIDHPLGTEYTKWKSANQMNEPSTLVAPASDSKVIRVAEVRRRPQEGQSTTQGADVWETASRRGRSPGGHEFLGLRDVIATGRHIENASSADRIAQFPPGTRFRVAVDKGETGLGVTVKEIQGRFFVYRMVPLPDGSLGAAEEAGVKAGDELLGVEELDFESERWTIDQLVSYMKEIVGVVILHMMRGRGPLMMPGEGEEEAEMSQGVPQVDGEDGTVNAAGRSNLGSANVHVRRKENARRLVEVLEQEGVVKPSEAADVTRLYCQIRDRAHQWDSGELWLSVAELARRPSPKAASSSWGPWKPGEPPGWDGSESSGGDSSMSGSNLSMDSKEGMKDAPPDPDRRSGGRSEPADLDTIGTALLGQPLFADTLPLVELEALGHGKTKERGSRTEWSPWPQIAALENDAGAQYTDFLNHRIRKALNVRVLEQVESIGSPDRAGRSRGSGKGEKADDAKLRLKPYIVWVMDVESGAEWRVERTHAEFVELRDVCTGMRPFLKHLDFPHWLPEVPESPGKMKARRPRLEGYLQRLCSLLYTGPLHPFSAHLAHLLQDFLGTTPRVEVLSHLQMSRPERELRQALQVRAWQVLRLPPLEKVVAEFVKGVMDSPLGSTRKGISANVILKKLTETIDRLQYVITEGCFDELREMVRASKASRENRQQAAGTDTAEGRDGGTSSSSAAAGATEQRVGEGGGGERGAGNLNGRHEDVSSVESAARMEDMAVEDEALELISGSVRRQVEAEVFVPVMGRLYYLLRTEGDRAQQERAVALGIRQARNKPQSYHGIPERYISLSSWAKASHHLKAVGSFTLPSDKLDALVAVAHAIPELYRAEHPDDDSHQLGADDFLPIFVYVLVNSGVEGVASLAVILDTLCDPKRMMGEAGFCVATLSAAIQHLVRSARNISRKKARSSSMLSRRSL